MPVKLTIAGACGRMGSRIATLALADSVFALAGALEAKGHPSVGQPYGSLIGQPSVTDRVSDDASRAIGAGDVVIDFTLPEPSLEHLCVAAQHRKPMVIGTTGFSEAQRAQIDEASRSIPIVLSPNMSVGVNLLFELVELAAARLGLGYDVEVVEAHHKAKKDAPSGTAKRLVEGIASARRQPAGTVPTHALRAGDIVGDHTVVFAGPSERLELTHRAHSRDAFAQGALRAAKFLIGRKAGLYDMSHVLKAE